MSWTARRRERYDARRAIIARLCDRAMFLQALFRIIGLKSESSRDGAIRHRIIPRDKHGISRQHISKPALHVLYRLRQAGYAAFLVGGAVRDLLLGGRPKDFDVATDATPEQVTRLFAHCRLIGHRFRLAHVIFGGEIIEVATFRGAGEDGDRHIIDGRIVRDNVWGTIEEDAIRRDFRVNAMYYNIADFSVRDDVGGMQDLDQRVLRLIGDPERRYREDPVRMLRAVRLAAKLGFRIDAEACRPFDKLGSLLAQAPPARLFDESLKLFLGGHALASLHALEAHGLIQQIFPLTARRLRSGDPALRALIEQGLANTDARVAAGKPVTPAFLFALLLWGEARARVQTLMAQGVEQALAWQRAAAGVVAEQSRHVAMPKRFSYAMEEIWALQPRLALCTRKRALRLLAHPRFRAAYDFLLLRADESDEVRELGQWWTRVQDLSPQQLADALGVGGNQAVAAKPTAAMRKRRRGVWRRRVEAHSQAD